MIGSITVDTNTRFIVSFGSSNITSVPFIIIIYTWFFYFKNWRNKVSSLFLINYQSLLFYIYKKLHYRRLTFEYAMTENLK